jgi:hypothetical protein
MAHTITVSQTIGADVTYVMPWQPGYREWAEKNPGLVDGTVSLGDIVKTWKEKVG